MGERQMLRPLGEHTKPGDKVVAVDATMSTMEPGTVLTVSSAHKGKVFEFVEDPDAVYLAHGFRHCPDPIAAAEADLLGEALTLLDQIAGEADQRTALKIAEFLAKARAE